MKRRPWVALLVVGLVAGVLLLALFAASSPFALSPMPTNTRGVTRIPSSSPTVRPTATRVILKWEWPKPGFSGKAAVTLTQGIEQYSYYGWSTACDAPDRHQVPMIPGKESFYTDHVGLAKLFNGPCNDGRPLLFLNEPAKAEQANVSPTEAAHMFYTMTRGVSWQYERWHGSIYAGNNLVEDQAWDAEFVKQFARLHNRGKLAIPEIAGWGIHLYGNYEYGPKVGDPNVVWTQDIPFAAIGTVVDRSMRLVDEYVAQRKTEGNSGSLVVTEFGLLQASTWHEPPTHYYTTTVGFMDEYVRRFNLRPEIQAWQWFLGAGSKDEFLDTDLMVDARGALTPNGARWRELAGAAQP